MLGVMVVEPQQLVRLGLRHVLAEKGEWRICGEASNTQQAVALAEQFKPAVAILGLLALEEVAATRKIREASPGTEVLILAEWESDVRVRAVLSAGAKGFLSRAEAATHLLTALQACAMGIPFVGERGRGVAAPAAPQVNSCARARRPPSLTAREREIAALLAEGKSNWCIATILGISEKTVETHRGNLMQKLGLQSVVELVHYAVRSGMISINLQSGQRQ